MEHLSLVPNLNLRRLINDLLNEGGEGLYIQTLDAADGSMADEGGGRKKKTGRGSGREGWRSGDSSHAFGNNGQQAEYRFALVTEHILVVKVCWRSSL